MHTFKRGDKVWVINRTWGGKFIVEGQAVILKTRKGVDEQYQVRFIRNGEPSLGEEYDRFIDPNAQRHPELYVNAMNSTHKATPQEA